MSEIVSFWTMWHVRIMHYCKLLYLMLRAASLTINCQILDLELIIVCLLHLQLAHVSSYLYIVWQVSDFLRQIDRYIFVYIFLLKGIHH